MEKEGQEKIKSGIAGVKGDVLHKRIPIWLCKQHNSGVNKKRKCVKIFV